MCVCVCVSEKPLDFPLVGRSKSVVAVLVVILQNCDQVLNVSVYKFLCIAFFVSILFWFLCLPYYGALLIWAAI